MEQQNQSVTNQNQSELQQTWSSLEIFNRELVKVIADSAYILGFSGDKEILIGMANKIQELYGDFDVSIVRDILEKYVSSETELKFGFNITSITSQMRSRGMLTLKEKDTSVMDKFYEFQQS